MSRLFLVFLFSLELVSYSYAQTNTNQEKNVNEKSTFVKWLSKGHISGPRFGVYTSGVTSVGLLQMGLLQNFLCRFQYGLMCNIRIANNIGIQLEVMHTKMGNKSIPISLPIDSSDKKDDGDIGSVLDEVTKSIKFKKEQTIYLNYISIPITFCFLFKSSRDSYITNYFMLGPQINILLSARRKLYKTPPMFTQKADGEWDWATTEVCSNCVINESLKDEIPKLDFGFAFGYMFKTKEEALFGLKYYEGVRKLYYKRDQNSFYRQRRNMGVELFFGYNILGLFI